MKATIDEVNSFLVRFKEKAKNFDIIYEYREKNLETLAFLEMAPKERDKHILSLTAEDYSQGPIEDIINEYKELWVFGKIIKKQEIYIKISIGDYNNPVICISFHIAESTIRYPFKNR